MLRAALKGGAAISRPKISKWSSGTVWLTLEGAVEWNYARERAESSVKRVRGVKGVTNAITLKPKVQPHEVRRKIEDALRRSAELDASRITVEANGDEVDFARHGEIVGRASGGRTRGLGGAGSTSVENRITISV